MASLLRGLLWATVVLSHSAFAQEVPIFGAGGQSCGAFIAATGGLGPGLTRSVKEQDGETYYSVNALYNQWALAFLSASNLLTASNIKVDLAGVDLWLRNWCNNNPTSQFAAALLAFQKSESGR
jgi:hypothetical protein